ncbi:MAG TPA: hypothetical protein VHT25_11595 [Solirubrobacteraceae bacterium]|jgi:hypothetical protein|nr:hypothetical protein [Solirubrobacteraceae bacterium]
MNEFLGSLKADLLDRRLRPVLLLVGVALLAAVAYASFGGGGSSSATPPASSASAAAPATPGVSVREAGADTKQPVAETTNGTAQQRKGILRNPFAAVPGVKTAKAAAAPASSASATGTSKTSGASGESSGGSSGGESQAGSKSGASEAPSANEEKTSQTKKSSKPAKQTVYHVTVMFGVAPAGTPPLSAQLTPYDNLKRQQPLPSTAQPLVVFRGVTAGGKSATFTLVGEAILRGQGACQPDASQCLAIDLKPGQYEELEYVPPEGTPVVYQLQVVKIDSTKASAAAARAAFGSESKVGIQFLHTAGLDALPGMRYSPDKGVLVFAHHPAFIARAHAAAWGAWLRS